MTEPSTVVDGEASGWAEDTAEADVEDPRTQRRRLAAVWLGAGSAVAAMVGVSWYVVARNGHAPGGDMIGHAAAAEWLRTLPWWDWRGWSDWFYGGQAMGVTYPPLGHAWMRFTDPYHGQMAAVAIGLLFLLPWGALRIARAVGYKPGAQRAAIAGALVLTAASGDMHWILSGFHSESTFFSSWPAMMATVIGLHVAAWAARCQRPLACGALAGIALLLNASVVPGIAAVCVVLLATSGASFGRAVRWTATASAAALAVCAWWLVPFLAGWDRLVRWEVRLLEAWEYGGLWQVAVLASVAVGAAWAARDRSGPSRRLALSALGGLLLSVLADLVGFQRPERWLEFSVLVAALAASNLFAAVSRDSKLKPARPAWMLLGAAFLLVLVVVTGRLEAIPLVVWLIRGSRQAWAWGSALAWAAVLALVPLWSQARHPARAELAPAGPLEAVAASVEPRAVGLVEVDSFYNNAAGDVRQCSWGLPWRITAETGGRVRPLFGLYGDTSHSAEFLLAESQMRSGAFGESGRKRPHWFDAWKEAGSPSLDSRLRAEALGARWYVACDSEGVAAVTELPGLLVSGVSISPHTSKDSWHRSAVEWWISIGNDSDPRSFQLLPQSQALPVLWFDEAGDYALNQPAREVTLLVGRDRLAVTAADAGWAWLRVPWDPYWRATDDSPVLKGGPGHLVVWANRGTTELRWEVPDAVDAAAAAVTGIGLLAAAALVIANRRRGWNAEPAGRRSADNALDVFTDTVDGWVRAAGQQLRRRVTQTCRGDP